MTSFMKTVAVLGAAMVFANGCASSPSEPNNGPTKASGPEAEGDPNKKDPPERRQQAHFSGAAIFKQARAIAAEKGCQEAIPALRITSAIGPDFSAAQHELAVCLLNASSDYPAEIALFQQEAMFWLNRAAYSGNARAQRVLAIEFSKPTSDWHDPVDALKWALVFEGNPSADLYAPKLPVTLVEGLKRDLGEAKTAEATDFAATFKPVPMAKYVAPPPEREAGGQRRQGQGQQGGGQQRRRRR